MPNGHRRRGLSYEQRITLLAIGAGFPGVVAAFWLLIAGGYSPKTIWTLGILIAGVWLALAYMLRERIVRPLQTISNMLAALREGDFSLRGRRAGLEDALGLAMLETNLLGETLKAQRLGALEATALLRTVMAEIDVAIFAFDDSGALALVNRAGERLLDQPRERLIGKPASAVGLGELIGAAAGRVHDHAFPGRSGRWEIHRTTFRQDGRPHTLLVLADVSRTLREEELQAWQRLVRVLSHEINNSLAPIKSLADTLRKAVDRAANDRSASDDLRKGLGIIMGRAEALSRFMASYAKLARLPAPRRAALDLGSLVRRVAALEVRLPVSVKPGPDVVLAGDADQLEQLLINLVRNAADAALETGGKVEVTWHVANRAVTLDVLDEGPGLTTTANLFVPFFTTKADGSGIGLVLSRQIAEAHGGMLTLENRGDRTGCLARLV
ncbi:MAG TPA: ATP-binding protein, partial [Gemmatimonadaceae bacterium]|nr:ATP-binding protein [Gemmatimonadaceae bacterium]